LPLKKAQIQKSQPFMRLAELSKSQSAFASLGLLFVVIKEYLLGFQIDFERYLAVVLADSRASVRRLQGFG
jgi:hypothetical protein